MLFDYIEFQVTVGTPDQVTNRITSENNYIDNSIEI